MKKYIIKIAKKNELLYRIAKRFYRSIRPAAPTYYRNYDYNIAYEMEEENQLSLILDHYAKVKKTNTRLLILWKGNPLCLHRLMREHPFILFLSIDYYERYHQKLMVNHLIFADYQQDIPSVLRLI